MTVPEPDEIPIEPITPAEEVWLARQCAELDRQAADELPRSWPVVFLDLDDVLCVNEPFGAWDAMDALQGKRGDAAQVYMELWSPRAKAILQGAHERFGGQLRYVISSSWRLLYTRTQLREVMRLSGLAFVADGMEPRERWATPSLPTKSRAHEVLAWLGLHHLGEPFVVLDDEYSGLELRTYRGPGASLLHRRVVLCEEWQGLWPSHWPRIVAALSTPCPREREGGQPA